MLPRRGLCRSAMQLPP